MKIISLIGRPGCGKGTQIKRLIEKTGWEAIKTGELLRERATEDDFIGKKLDKSLSEGRLIPTPVVFNIWMPKIIKIREKGSAEGIIFDGNPRKFYEAKMLDEVFNLFEWSEHFMPIYIDISEEEAKERLLERGRADDNKEEIKRRLEWFESDVLPVLEYYREKGILIEIDGERPIEEVKEDIFKVLNLDD
jgi:adenylate kinase